MGRGGAYAPKSAAFIFGSGRTPVRPRRPLLERARDWAEDNPLDYAKQVVFLDIPSGANEGFIRLAEGKAAAEHDDVCEGRAEVVIERVLPTKEGEVALHYFLSALGGEEVRDDIDNTLVLSPEDLRQTEILSLVAPQLGLLHRQGRIALPR